MRGGGKMSNHFRNADKIHKIKNVLLATTAFVAISGAAFAQSAQWQGGVSADWLSAGNWISGVVPGSASDVLINKPYGNAPRLTIPDSDTTISIRSLGIGFGAGSTGELNLFQSHGILEVADFIRVGSGAGADGLLMGVGSNSGYYSGIQSSSAQMEIGSDGGKGAVHSEGGLIITVASMSIGSGQGSSGIVELKAVDNYLYSNLSAMDGRLKIGTGGGTGVYKADFGTYISNSVIKRAYASGMLVGDGIGSKGSVFLLGKGKNPGKAHGYGGEDSLQSGSAFIGINGGTGYARIEEAGWALNGMASGPRNPDDLPGLYVGVGTGSVGTVDILSGGKVTHAYSSVYFQPSPDPRPIGLVVGEGGTGTVNVAGANEYVVSTLTSGSGMTIGYGSTGAGFLNISDKAAVRSFDVGYRHTGLPIDIVHEVGANGGTGVVSVSGAGSSLSISGERRIFSSWQPGIGTGGTTSDLVVGASGAGTVILADGATINVGVIGIDNLFSAGASIVGYSTNGIVHIGRDAGSHGTFVYGGLPGEAPAAVGTLNADGIVFGTGNGTIAFNHTNMNYQFEKPISGEGALDIYAGITWIGRDNRTGFTHQRDIFDPSIGDYGDYAVVGETFDAGFSGFTRLRGGLLGLANDGALGSSTIQGLANSTLIYGTDPVSGGGVDIANTMEIYGGVELSLRSDAGNAATQAGAISGAGGFRKTGEGALTLTADNTLTGQVKVSEGTLALTGIGEISQAARVVADGTFNISAATDGASIRSLAGSGSVALGPETLTITAADDLFSGVISGSGGLNLTAGTETLSGANAYSGETTITSGILRAGATNTFSPNSVHNVLSGGALDMGGYSQTIAGLSNAGTVLMNGAPGTVLTVAGDYVGNGGSIYMSTTLGDDSSITDRLVIDGGRASGTTTLMISNVLGVGALTTGNGIPVVVATNGGSAADVTFLQGTRIAAGAYDYTLYRNGIGGSASDGNWYLRSTVEPTPPDPGPGTDPKPDPGPDPIPGPDPAPEPKPDPGPEPKPDPAPKPDPVPGPVVPPRQNYRVELPLAASIAPVAMEYGHAMLGTMHERIGEGYGRAVAAPSAYEDRVVVGKDGKRTTVRFPSPEKPTPSQFFNGTWARLIGNRGFRDNNNNFVQNGPDYNYTFAGIQAGLDIYGSDNSFDGGMDTAGVYVGYGQINAEVKGAYGGRAGSIDMEAYTVGAYWTHRSPVGWYSDAVIQGTWYSTEARSSLGQQLKPDGFGITASLEGGYTFHLDNGWIIEPQAQLVYQNVSFGDFVDAYGRFSLDDGESLRGRLGIRVARDWNVSDGAEPRLITTWVRANLWHEFLGDTRTMVTDHAGMNPVTIPSDLGGTWGEIGAGISGQISSTMTFFLTGAYSHSLDNRGYEAWNGRLGIYYRW